MKRATGIFIHPTEKFTEKALFFQTSKKRTTIYVDGCVDATIKYFLSEDNLILLVCVGGAMVLLQVSFLCTSTWYKHP